LLLLLRGGQSHPDRISESPPTELEGALDEPVHACAQIVCAVAAAWPDGSPELRRQAYLREASGRQAGEVAAKLRRRCLPQQFTVPGGGAETGAVNHR